MYGILQKHHQQWNIKLWMHTLEKKLNKQPIFTLGRKGRAEQTQSWKKEWK